MEHRHPHDTAHEVKVRQVLLRGDKTSRVFRACSELATLNHRIPLWRSNQLQMTQGVNNRAAQSQHNSETWYKTVHEIRPVEWKNSLMDKRWRKQTQSALKLRKWRRNDQRHHCLSWDSHLLRSLAAKFASVCLRDVGKKSIYCVILTKTELLKYMLSCWSN